MPLVTDTAQDIASSQLSMTIQITV